MNLLGYYISSRETFICNNITEEENKSGMKVIYMNNSSKSAFEDLTEKVGPYGRTKLQYAEGIIQNQHNGCFSHGINTGNK